ncbi:hypothetical protein MPLB_2300055 [Mesorhizobium sp. ORS 3324]|nr:hypothetical protein MPLB_2300055 [Mesorhizobium sp. ORS 3324]
MPTFLIRTRCPGTVKGESNADQIPQSDTIRYAEGIHLADQIRHRAGGESAAQRAA